MTHLLLRELFQTIQNEAKLEAIAEEPKNPYPDNNTLTDNTQWHNVGNIPLYTEFTDQVTENEQSQLQFTDSALQTSLQSFSTEKWDTNTRSVSEEQPSQATPTYWLLSPSKPHMPVQQSDEQPNKESSNLVAISKAKQLKFIM